MKVVGDAEVGRDVAQLTLPERLARAVLMFHRGAQWTALDREIWEALTGERDATTKVLCDLARRVRDEAERT